MSQARYAVDGAVAVITMDNPPGNGLGHELRRGIVEGIDRAAADPAVRAVVISGAGKAFSGGADIRSAVAIMSPDEYLPVPMISREANERPAMCKVCG